MSEIRIACLGDFQEDGKRLDPQGFAALHGEAFLLHFGPIGDLKFTMNGGDTLATSTPGDQPGQAFNPRSDYLVFPVRPGPGRESARGELRVGRTTTNDIVIPDASISSLHAYIRQDPTGAHFLLDADSSNGSFVDDVRVAIVGEGQPVPLSSGARVRVGRVDLSFLLVPEFCLLVNNLLES